MASAPTVAKAASTNDDDSYTAPPTPIAHTPGASRPPIVGDDSPSPPYPIYARGKVTRGFGRGSKELGCPTANLPDAAIAPLLASNLKTGVHFGFAKVDFSTATGLATGGHDKPLPMVMSVGWNPQYANERRTAVRSIDLL